MAKKKKRNSGAPRQSGGVRLSQCMIVKDEEKNIEKALSWGKDIMFEQIVVDTGSTDRTVEIAELMGAKVLHFQWIKDFAAAKNFAIGHAKGNWIAFLDADEYIEKDEVKHVMPLLEHIMADAKMRRNYLAVNCPWVQLNDEGVPKDVLLQERIFQNLPKVRYVGRIHEKLSLEMKNCVQTKDFRIMHTGYTGESFLQTGKASRNVELLRLELKENPKNISIKGYLAESLRAEAVVEKTTAENPDAAYLAEIEAKFAEADKLFMEVADSHEKVEQMHKKNAYDHFMRTYTLAAEVDPELEKMSLKAYREFPDDAKFKCYYAMALNKKGDFHGALNILKECQASLNDAKWTSSELTTTITEMYAMQMVFASQGLGDIKNVLKHAEILLLMNKANLGVLIPYISTLTRYYSSIEDILDELARVYDMSSKKDLLLIARGAKNCGAIDLAKRIIDVVAYLGNDN